MADSPCITDPIGRDEVRVLCLSIESLSLRSDLLRNFLSPEEKERAARYRLQDARRDFELCRGFLRALLGSLTGVAPSDIAFGYGAFGKPFLKYPQSDLHFNGAHSRGYAAFALTRAGEVGVDIEGIREHVDHDAIAARYFSEAERMMMESASPERKRELFFEIWTRREALVKAMGISVLKGGAANGSWWVRPLESVEGLRGAVAGEGMDEKRLIYYHNDNYISIFLNSIVNTN